MNIREFCPVHFRQGSLAFSVEVIEPRILLQLGKLVEGYRFHPLAVLHGRDHGSIAASEVTGWETRRSTKV